MTPTEARLTFTGQGVWCVGTAAALVLLLRPCSASNNNDNNDNNNNNNNTGDGRWRVLTPAFSLYLLAHAVASLLNMIGTAPYLISATNANVANVSIVNTTTTATANGAEIATFITATAIPVYVLLATRLLTPARLRPLRFAIVAGALIYLCFVLIVTLSSVAPVVVLFAFYLFAAVYGAIALVRYESWDERSPMYQPNPVCGRRCRRPLLLATVVGVVDFLLPAFAFLAGNDLAVAWLGLVGRLGDIVGYLPIVVQTFRYVESDARRDSLPLENPWLFWKCCDVDDGGGVR